MQNTKKKWSLKLALQLFSNAIEKQFQGTQKNLNYMNNISTKTKGVCVRQVILLDIEWIH
jgi:hypothetical protein